MPEVVFSEMPPLNSLTRVIRRVRQNVEAAPALPTNLEELVIPEEYQTLVNGDKFLGYDSGPGLNRKLIFCTKKSLDYLTRGGVLLGDGTFSVVPNLFSQMYTLHGYEEGHSIPCIFALTAHRTADIYTELLSFVKRERPAYAPRLIVSDYEQAALNSFSDAFPMARRHGCLLSELQITNKLC